MSKTTTKTYAALVPGGPLVPFVIDRRAPGPHDVAIAIKFAGICHSDIHQVKEDWGSGIFPMVPGHEISGIVTEVGSSVTKFKVGDIAGVGCMVDSCRECKYCRLGDEQYCQTGMVGTYNSKFKYPHCIEYQAPTYGGYSQFIVVDENFTIKMPNNIDLAAATPLLCAGITTYSPLMHYGLRPNQRLGVVGLGGLGHMAVKFGVAFGAHVTVISRGTKKKESALGELKAHAYIDSTDPIQMKSAVKSFDLIINTIASNHDMNPIVELLNIDGKMVLVGVDTNNFSVKLSPLIMKRATIAGSLIGGIQETQEMMDFCGRHNIVCDIEMISADKINEAYVRTVNSDVKYRFVIDVSTI